MQVTFLGQGLQESSASTGKILIDAFQNSAFERFTAFVAFASKSGIEQLTNDIIKSKKHISTWNLFVGVDRKSTSKEALSKLLDLDINTSIYYTVTPITYHPKIYLFEGRNKCQIIIGSSNFTKSGLFSNVEANLIIDIKFPDADGSKLVTQIQTYFEKFLNNTDQNTQPLSQECIELLQKSKIIIYEDERQKLYEIEYEQSSTINSHHREQLREIFPPLKSSNLSSRTNKQDNKIRNIGKRIREYHNDYTKWRQYGIFLANCTKEGVNLYWKIGKKNNHINIQLWALNIISQNTISRAQLDKLLREKSKIEHPLQTMEGTRALFLSKILGLVQKRSLQLTDAYYEMGSNHENDMLSNQLEKFYFWNGIFSKTDRHVKKSQRIPPNKYFHIYPIFFIYQVLITLKEKYNYIEPHISKFEMHSFVYVARQQSDADNVATLIVAYRTDTQRDVIEEHLEEKNNMDSRLYSVLKLCRYFNWTEKSISVKKHNYEEMKTNTHKFTNLLDNNSLIKFDDANPNIYYDMLYSKHSLLEYHSIKSD